MTRSLPANKRLSLVTVAVSNQMKIAQYLQLPKHVQVKECAIDWIGLSSVLRPRQQSIGYMGDGFYRSKDPTNSIKVLKEHIIQR